MSERPMSTGPKQQSIERRAPNAGGQQARSLAQRGQAQPVRGRSSSAQRSGRGQMRGQLRGQNRGQRGKPVVQRPATTGAMSRSPEQRSQHDSRSRPPGQKGQKVKPEAEETKETKESDSEEEEEDEKGESE